MSARSSTPVATVLRYEGFTVEEASSGREALAKAQGGSFDLVILDVMLPDLDGFEVTRRLRADGIRTPVLFLTARAEVEDRVAGLEVGGDDYVVKPFSLAEIVARTKAILRRVHGDPVDHALRFADLEMDEESHEVFRAGVPVQLTATEFNLLRLFLLNPRRVSPKNRSSTTSGTTTSWQPQHRRDLRSLPAAQARTSTGRR